MSFISDNTNKEGAATPDKVSAQEVQGKAKIFGQFLYEVKAAKTKGDFEEAVKNFGGKPPEGPALKK